MLSINSIKYYSKINLELEKLDDSISFINTNLPSNEKKELMEKILGSGVSSTASDFHYVVKRVNNETEKIKINYINRFKNFKKDFNVLNFFGNLNEIKNNFQLYCKEYDYTDENIVSLLNDLYKVATLYQNIIQDESNANIIEFLEKADAVCVEYYSTRKGINCFINCLGNESFNPTYEYTKSLDFEILDCAFNVGEFGNILVLLDEAYNSLKTLFKNEEVMNLEIIKIESGSLMSKIFGNDNIIDLLSLIIKTAAKEMYQKFTLNGKIQKQQDIMNMISNSADVINKLEELGINTAKSKSDLKDCLNITTNNIYKILSKSGKISIDDEIISISNTDKLLEYKTKYLDNSLDKKIGDEK